MAQEVQNELGLGEEVVTEVVGEGISNSCEDKDKVRLELQMERPAMLRRYTSGGTS